MGGGGGWYILDICFSRSVNECSRSQNLSCLNRCDFYSRKTKYFDLKNYLKRLERMIQFKLGFFAFKDRMTYHVSISYVSNHWHC